MEEENEKNSNENRLRESTKNYIKKQVMKKLNVKKIASLFFKKKIIIFIGIAIVVFGLLAAITYQLKLIDTKENPKDAKNGPAAVRSYMNNSTIDENGNIVLDKTVQEFWDELKSKNNRITSYLNSPEQLAKLMNADLATQYLDTRENPDEPIDWAEINKDVTSKNVQGIIKLKRALFKGETITMTYVNPLEFQSLVDTYNESPTEENKKNAMQHFTLEKGFNIAGYGNTGFISGNANFTKYTLTDKQIADFAKLCANEQGNNDWRGLCAQATYFVNLYEIHNKVDCFGQVIDGNIIYQYERNRRDKSAKYMDMEFGNPDRPINELCKQAVKSVMCDGYRTIPAYVDEHDSLAELTKIVTDNNTYTNKDDIKNPANYKVHNTRIYNEWDSNYWFYCFPNNGEQKNEDPFGYIHEDYRQKVGDAYYESSGPGDFRLINGSTGTKISISNILSTSTKANNASQVVTVIGPTSDKNYTVTLWDKKTGNWTQSISTTEGAVGKNGLTDSSSKREGDGKTPKGFYDILSSFGRDSNPGTKLAYRQIKEDSYWTQKTNRWTNIKDNLGGTEYLWEYRNGAYKYAMVIGYNYDEYVDGKGSAIFLHCKTGDSTAGCISVPENIMLDYMKNIGNNAYIAIASDETELASILGSTLQVNNTNTNSTINNTTSTTYTPAANTMDTGHKIVAEAMKYVGNPYVYGGNSLTNGIDCSHFVWQILKICGVYNGSYRTSGGWASVGEEVASLSEAMAGDVIVYSGHVAIYDGAGLIIEAKGAGYGITHDRKVDCKNIKAIRRFTNDTSPGGLDGTTYTNNSLNNNMNSQNTTYVAKVATFSSHTDKVKKTLDGKVIVNSSKTTYNMTTQQVPYHNYVDRHTLPFNYLWAMLVISENKDFVLDLADLVYNSQFEITIHDNLNINTNIVTEKYTEDVQMTSKGKITITGVNTEENGGSMPISYSESLIRRT